MCEIKRTYFRVLLFLLQHKIRICWDNGRKRKKKQVTSVPVVAAYGMLTEKVRIQYLLRGHICYLFLFSFSVCLLHKWISIWCWGERRGVSTKVCAIFHILSFRYWFSKKSRHFLSTGDFHWLIFTILWKFPTSLFN